MKLVSRSGRLVAGTLGALLLISGTAPPSAAAAPPGDSPSEPLSDSPRDDQADPVRRGPGLQSYELAPVAGASPTGRSLGGHGSARAEAAAGARAVTERVTRPFALVGVTWTDPEARLEGTVEVRTRSVATGAWTEWQELDSDGVSPAAGDSVDGGGRGRTDPLWVGTSDAVQAQVAARGAGEPLPEGMRLDLINPDEDQAATPVDSRDKTSYPGASLTPPTRAGSQAATPVDSRAKLSYPGASLGPPTRAGSRAGATTSLTSRARTASRARVATPARPVPKMITRGGWGANESIVKDPPEFSDDVQVVFVHHTAGTNGYSCRDSARIVRGIQLYQVRSNGWNDIGYNFLVDRCGTLFEGRKGGVGRAVLGAHTLGFNAHSSAIAVLGNYGSVGVSARVRTAIAQVSAYKLGAHGNLAGSRTRLLSSGSDRYPKGKLASLYRISGHRDTGQTACPGTTLYGQIPSIRRVAGAGPAGLRLLRLTGATAAGSAWYTRGLISPLWTTGTPSALLNRFDVYVDGKPAVSARNTHRKATLRLSPGRHVVTVRATHLSGRTASFSRTVIADATAPRFTTGPALVLRKGGLNGSVPVRLGWAAADTGGLRAISLTRPFTRALGATATGWNTTALPGRPTTFGLRATDRAGNARNASVTRTPMVVSEATAARAGKWTSLRSSAYLSGAALRSSARGATLTWTVNGRSAALAATRTTGSGRITVYLDGQPAGTVDLRSTRTLHRQAVWAKNWGSEGRHTIRVVVQGTATLDGLISLR